MKRIKDFFKLFRMLKRSSMHLAWYQIVESVMKMATDVNTEHKPMMSEIAVVDMGQPKLIGDLHLVSIWAGVGNANPIKRIGHLRAQNDAMKDLLKICRTKVGVTEDNDLILNINIVLDTFE